MEKHSQSLLVQHLKILESKCKNGDPTLKDVFDSFGPQGHYILILFLVLPFLQPVPLMGLSTPFGLLIAIVAAMAFANKPPWLPQKWFAKKVHANTVTKIAEGSERVFKKVSFMIHPRLKFFFRGLFRPLNAFLLISNAIIMALPIPIPFSNALPAWVILFQTLAHMEEDGFFIVLSYFQTALCIIYFIVLAKGLGSGLEAMGIISNY